MTLCEPTCEYDIRCSECTLQVIRQLDMELKFDRWRMVVWITRMKI